MAEVAMHDGGEEDASGAYEHVVDAKRLGARDGESPSVHPLVREPSTLGRLARHAGRAILWLAVGLVLISGIRALVAPEEAPLAQGDAPVDAAPPWPDDAARAFAVSATRALLTFGTEANYGRFHELGLAPYLAPHLDASTVVDLPERGPPQRVVEATVARAELLDDDHALVTVAATVEQQRSAVRYVTLPIARDDRGGLAVYDLPSFSPSPARAVVDTPRVETLEPEVHRELERMLVQFFPLFLAGRDKALRPYLPADSRLRALDHAYALVELVSLAERGPAGSAERSLIAEVTARDTESGAVYALRYLLEVVPSDVSETGWLVESVNGQGGEG